MILDFAYWLEANKYITNDSDKLVNEYMAFIDKQIGGVNYTIINGCVIFNENK